MTKENAEAFVIEVNRDHLGLVDAAVKSFNGTIASVGSIKRHIVTIANTSESDDGKPKVLDVFEHKEDAEAFVRNDMESFVDDAAGMGLIVDFEKMSAHTDDFRYGREWSIEEVEIKL